MEELQNTYTGIYERRLNERTELNIGFYIRVPKKGGGKVTFARTTKNVSRGGVGVYTEDLGLGGEISYDAAIVAPTTDKKVIKVRMFNAYPRHMTAGVTGFALIAKVL